MAKIILFCRTKRIVDTFNFEQLIGFYKQCNEKNYPQPIDWEDNICKEIQLLKTKCINLLVFEIENENNSDIYACTLASNDIPLTQENGWCQYIPLSDSLNIVYGGEKKKLNNFYINLMYNLSIQNKNISTNEYEDGYDCQAYLEACSCGDLQYIKFTGETTWKNIYLSYITYRLDTDYKVEEASPPTFIMAVKQYMKVLDINDLRRLVEYLNYTNEIHIFFNIYTHVEQYCVTKNNDTKFCTTCSSYINKCESCRPKNQNHEGVCWRTTKKALNNWCETKAITLEGQYKLYSGLKDHRNNIFHHKGDRDDSIAIIKDDFSSHIYALVLALLALTEYQRIIN